MHKISLEWLRLLETALTKIEKMPLLEERFPFPWKGFSDQIKEVFNFSDLEIRSEKLGWKSSQEAVQFLGENPVILTIEGSSINEGLFFVMSRHDVAYLVSQTLDMDKDGFFRDQLQEGFYHFLFLKVLEVVDGLKIFKNMTFQLSSFSGFIPENNFCIDAFFSLSSKTIQGRVIFPESFVKAFTKFAPMKKETLLDFFHDSGKTITLELELGKIILPSEEWNKVKVGDFVVCDKCLYDPIEKKGSLTCMLGPTPLFVARIKPEGLKILSYVFPESAPTVSADDVVLSVEIDRVVFSMEELLYLEPETMMDVTLHPEVGVDLMLHDTKVARGELLKLGSTIGVRVVDMQKKEFKKGVEKSE